jgi:sarcosine oxidase subunit gamma
VAFEIGGPDARELLESGCPIDLHPRAFHAGSCAQTLLGRTGVLLHQVSDEPRYRLWVRPSFTRYLAAWLDDARVGTSPT